MRRLIVPLLVLVVLAGLLAAGWWWLRTWPQAAQLLEGAGLSQARAEQIVAWAGGPAAAPQPGELRASGSIEGDEVAIVSEFAGRIVSLPVEEGDTVEAYQVVVALDPSQIEAQLAQAQAAVAAAQANLANVQAGTHPAQILAAQAAVQQAMAQRDAARTAWDDTQAILDRPQDIDAQITQAQAAVDVATVEVERAQAGLKASETARDRYRAQGSLEEKGLYRVYQYQVEAARAAIDVAKANEAGARKTLAALKALRANPLPLISQVHVAEQRFYVAEAGVRVAEARLAELQAGPAAEDVRLAEAQVAKAEAVVSSLRVQLGKRSLRSPIDGIVTSQPARAGEAAIAGATLLTVANLDQVRLTVYIPEDELGRIYLGQQANVQVDSFPGQTFAGQVAYIAQQAEFTPKNVQTEKDRVSMVFAVRIRLPNPEHHLKPGMPADVVIGE